MSEKEYKAKCESMFAKNTVLINENAELKKENTELKAKLEESEVFIENIVKASADNPNEFFELRKENKELREQIENYQLSENESKEIIAELKSKLEKEQNLNKVIKERLVEVNCDCNAEKKEKCVMFPEYYEGERKTVVDLMSLVSDGLNESLIKQKDEQIEVKKLEILELKAQNKDLCKSLDIMNNRENDLLEQIEKMRCCQNCTHSTLNECDDLVCELNQFKFPEDYHCVNHSKWELPDE